MSFLQRADPSGSKRYVFLYKGEEDGIEVAFER